MIEPYAETVFFELIRRRRPRSSAELTRAEKDLARAEQSLADYRDNEAIQRSLGRDGFAAGIDKRAKPSAAHDCGSITYARTDWP